MRDFRKLIAWQKAHALAVHAHHSLGRRTAPLLDASTRTQLLRAIASVPANIAEGCGKRSEGEFARYLDIAQGSAKEVENHLLFARDMHWIDPTLFERLEDGLNEVQRLIHSLARSVRARAGGARVEDQSEVEARSSRVEGRREEA